MITADGERSRKRITRAKKALAIITMLDVPTKTSITEGFRYRVWQSDEGELSGGRVVAPLGVLVLYSHPGGITQFTLDSMQVAAGKIGDRWVLISTPLPLSPAGEVSILRSSASNEAAAYPANPSYVTGWKPPRAVVTPFQGEACLFDTAFERTSEHFVSATMASHCYSVSKLSADSAARPSGVSWAWSTAPSDAARISFNRIMPLAQYQTYWERVHFKLGVLWIASPFGPLDSIVAAYFAFFAPLATYSVAFATLRRLVVGAPPIVLAKMDAVGPNGGTIVTTFQHAGYCARTNTGIPGLTIVSFLFSIVSPHTVDTTDPSSIAAQEEMRAADFALLARVDHKAVTATDYNQWALVLGFYRFETTTAVTKTFVQIKAVILPLLASGGELAWTRTTTIPPDLVAAEADARAQLAAATTGAQINEADGVLEAILVKQFGAVWKALGALFGWPVENPTTTINGVRDTVTFHDSDGVVYSWLRSCAPGATQNAEGLVSTVRGGGFKFDVDAASGISRVPLVMPQQVLTDPTLRPCTLLANPLGSPAVYYCLADNNQGEIKGLHVGSPFSAWTEIPLPQGVTMYSVRMVSLTNPPVLSAFIGVGKTVVEGVSVYRVYFKPVSGDWVALSPIPVKDVVDLAASWDVCVFGDDPLAAAMQSIQGPTAAPAIPPNLR